MFSIRTFEEADWDKTWDIIEPIFRAGDTYAFPTDITREDAYQVWVDIPSETFVAVDEDNKILGTYYIKHNQQGPGDHVCNCGYIVSGKARGQGIASGMCEHSQRIAHDMGFRAMQYNLVVSTNKGAIRLWQRHSFNICGTLPGAFKHPELGFVDAYVMFKSLAD
jgi:ribosomal protein S18 acetylase RimI-like enzyme